MSETKTQGNGDAGQTLAPVSSLGRPRRWAVAARRDKRWLLLPGRYETESGARLTSEFVFLGGKVLVVEVMAGPDQPLAAPDAHTTNTEPTADGTLLGPPPCSPSASRKADGWAPTLEYTNGGRVVGQQRCGSMDEAVEESRQMIQGMSDYPVSFWNNHPAPNQLIDLGEDTRKP